MQFDAYPSVSLHNVAEVQPAAWAGDGHRLARVPGEVAARLNVAARERLGHPTGVELRFVPTRDDASIEVTLSAPERTTVWPFWGAFQSAEPTEIGRRPRAITLGLPDRIRDLDRDEQPRAFDPRVCRLRFDSAAPVALHDVEGRCRPPSPEERPEDRYLAYGTSITEGAASTAPHLAYVAQTARRLGVDPLNLGCSGSAFCEPAMAEYLADREDWDVATLSLSVNMANRGFTVEQFRERAGHLVDAVASTHPETPIACITLFPYHADLVRGDDPERATEFRAALRTTVEESQHEHLTLVEGPELMASTGLTTDALHPGDHGMIEIGRRLADRMDDIIE
ncbi:hypothetical protein GCM10028857_00300 [Salinarchaeum chitinilyticum]